MYFLKINFVSSAVKKSTFQFNTLSKLLQTKRLSETKKQNAFKKFYVHSALKKNWQNQIKKISPQLDLDSSDFRLYYKFKYVKI